jgi:hypothetical protein
LQWSSITFSDVSEEGAPPSKRNGMGAAMLAAGEEALFLFGGVTDSQGNGCKTPSCLIGPSGVRLKRDLTGLLARSCLWGPVSLRHASDGVGRAQRRAARLSPSSMLRS